MKVNWPAYIRSLTPSASFAPGVTPEALASAARELGTVLPDDLQDLLLQTNGVTGEYSLDLVWTLDRIVADNREFRADEGFARLYMSFDQLLFFADAGNGDQFA